MSFYSVTYNILGTAGAALTLPFWGPYVLAKRKYRTSLLRRTGLASRDLKHRLARKPNIWIHAVSVGEFNLAATLIDELRPHCPDHQFVVSVVTLTGYEVAQKRLSHDDVLLFFPIEFRPVMDRMVRLVNPAIAIIVETEIWPNFVYSLDRLGAPLVMVNGRISDRSFSRYRLVKPFIRDVLVRFARFNMQTDHGAGRIIHLGAPPERVKVTGNIKFDSARVVDHPVPDEALRKELSLPAAAPVFLAAALEKPGREDPVVIDVFEKLRARFPDAALIIVPRHPERGADIASLVSSRGYEPRRRSLMEGFDRPDKQVFIVDTVGELARFYTLARIVFVGKSLFQPGGGQNMIEPVGLGLPVIYGQHTANFSGIADVLAEHGGARVVADEDGLASAVVELWDKPEKTGEMVRKGQSYIRSQQGATRANVETVLSVLPPC